MRKSFAVLLALALPAALVHCTGDDPLVGSGDRSDAEAAETSTPAPGQDGSSGDAASDAACASGFATCNGGAACGTDLQQSADHCGACGHACLGAACLAGQCQPELIASGFERPISFGQGLAIDDTNLYFATTGFGSSNPPPKVYKVPKAPGPDAGGAAVVIHTGGNATGGGVPKYVATYGGAVFWTSDGASSNSGTVMTMSRDGAPNSATAIATGQQMPSGVVPGVTYTYWAASNLAPQTAGAIRRKQNGAGFMPVDLIPNQLNPWHTAVGPNKIYWDLNAGGANVLSVANTALNATPKTIVSLGSEHVSGIALNATGVFWVTYGSKEVWRATLDGDNPQKLHTAASNGSAIAVDETDAYVTFQGSTPPFTDGALVKVPASGAKPVTLAPLPFPQGVAVDSQFVYVVGGDYASVATDGKLWRIRK